MRIGLIFTNRESGNLSGPHIAVAVGLERLGHDIEIVTPGDWPVFSELPEAAFIWNGVNNRREKIVSRLRQAGVKTFIMEHGFFDRMNYTQIDHAGFNHTASWADKLNDPAPDCGKVRFKRAFGQSPVAVQTKNTGPILVIGQVAHDSQLRDSEIRHPQQLIDAVVDATPSDISIRFRPHPMTGWKPNNRGDRIEILDTSLKNDCLNARFAITINSNAGNEALGYGCPVLCLGPALYAMAGVAMHTHLTSMALNIRWMLEGVNFSRAEVSNYLYWLACRQWSNDELAQGRILADLIHRGMKT